MRILPCLWLGAALAAQQPAVPKDLQQLAETVDASHRPDGTTRQFHAFAAVLDMKQTAADQGRGEATLKVRFLEHQPKNRKHSQPLIRYRIVDAATPIERGRDTEGYWQLVDDKPQDLETRSTTNDLAAVKRDTNLARQLLRFLDPGAVLRSLQDPEPVRDEELKLGRTEPIACRVATGTLASFPRLYETGDDTPVRLSAYVDRATSQLIAVELWPLDEAGKADRARGELLKLDDFRLQDGVELPTHMVLYRAKADGQRKKQMQVDVVSIELDPELTPLDFDRNERH